MTKNRPLAVICAVLLMISQSQSDYILGVKVSVAAAFSCAGFAICDQFSGAVTDTFTHNADCSADETPSTCCTASTVGRCSTGTFSVSGGVLVGAPTDPNGSGDAAALRAKTAAGGLTQYACTQFATYPGVSTALGQMGVVLRMDDVDTGSPSRAYGVVVSGHDNAVFWSGYSWSTTPAVDSWVWVCDYNSTSIVSYTFVAGDYICATVSGTGSATTLSVYRYASSDPPTAPPSGATNRIYTSGAVAPCGTAADTGTGVGYIYEGFSSGKTFDNFAGGGS